MVGQGDLLSRLHEREHVVVCGQTTLQLLGLLLAFGFELGLAKLRGGGQRLVNIENDLVPNRGASRI